MPQLTTPAAIDAEIDATHVTLARIADALDVPGLDPRIAITLTAASARLNVHVQELERRHSERGWNRWYLVTDGHLHRDISGSRCSRRPDTDHYWMVEHSGRGATEMINLAGDRVCTVCFPDAPVKPRPATGRFMTPTEAERAAHIEQARRDKAAKVAAQFTGPDGQPLRVPNGGVGTDVVKTERAAWNRALRAAGDLAFYGPHPDAPVWRSEVNLCVAALAHHRGVRESSLRVELNAKTAKKADREGWDVALKV